MDARDRLRRYLEQRREMGESEFALDSMSIEEAMKVMGGPATGAAPVAGRASPPQTESAPEPRANDPRARTEGSERAAAPETSDWREALRATGATPGVQPPAVPASPTPGATSARQPSESSPPPPAGRPPLASPPIEGAAGGPPLDLPPGIVVAKPASPGTSDIEALPSLDAIAAMVRECKRCPLYQTAIQGVPGEGNPNARFVVVGEAPGATEDETGRPFVGAAGQLLTKILAAINLRREDVFICNVIKHRPPGNRNPLPNEIAACSPYLIRQLELIRPAVILALGTFAAQTLLETKESIGKLRGRVHRYHGIPLIVTYHPAALLRNPAWKRPAWDDVQLARRILDSSADPRA